MIRASLLLGLGAGVAACEPPPDPPPPPPLLPCAADQPSLDVAPPDGDYGDLQDGGELWCGNPPQGGAPYTPFRFRLGGPEALSEGVDVEMIAMDPSDGSELAYTALTMGVTCANVGDNAGFWVGSEAHMRYFGYTLEDLDGVRAEVTIRAVPSESGTPVLEGTWTVDLTLEP